MAKKLKERLSLNHQLREAIQACGLTRYRIATPCTLHPSTLTRFLSKERALSPEAMNAIGDLLDLEIVMPGSHYLSKDK